MSLGWPITIWQIWGWQHLRNGTLKALYITPLIVVVTQKRIQMLLVKIWKNFCMRCSPVWMTIFVLKSMKKVNCIIFFVLKSMKTKVKTLLYNIHYLLLFCSRIFVFPFYLLWWYERICSPNFLWTPRMLINEFYKALFPPQ